MESAPDDILLLIFDILIHELHQPLSTLLPICRRFHRLLINTPTFWSRINIPIRSIQTIPYILHNPKKARLPTYLSRTWKQDTNVPLDISIVWHNALDEAGDHSFSCGVSPLEVFNCPQSPCNLVTTRERQLEELFRTLLTWRPSESKDRMNEVTTENLSFKRWRFLDVNLYGLVHSISTLSISLAPLGEQGQRGYIELPSLETLILRNFIATIQELRLPKLRRLELHHAGLNIFPPDIMKSVRSLVLDNAIYYMGTNASRSQLPSKDCINLQTLEIWGLQPYLNFLGAPFPSLSTIVYDVNVTSRLVEDLGTRFTEAHPLDTLVLLGMSVEGASYLLLISKKLRVKTVKLRSWFYHRYLLSGRSGPPSDDNGRVMENWVISLEELSVGFTLVTRMRERGTTIEALDPHMERILNMIHET